MKDPKYIINWLRNYADKASVTGFVVGVSGGIDSALTSILCAESGKKVVLLNMPIRQTNAEYKRAHKHIIDLKSRYSNVSSYEINLSETFGLFENTMPFNLEENQLAMANSRSRLRMTTLYAVAQANHCLVAGTGNKVEDFGVGFFTKYGDGGVDVSPIADLYKTEVFQMAKDLKVIDDILNAKPTDGLWEDGRSDEDQIGATYPELEWAMEYLKEGIEVALTERQVEVIAIYKKLHNANKHKMEPIPVCIFPNQNK